MGLRDLEISEALGSPSLCVTFVDKKNMVSTAHRESSFD